MKYPRKPKKKKKNPYDLYPDSDSDDSESGEKEEVDVELEQPQPNEGMYVYRAFSRGYITPASSNPCSRSYGTSSKLPFEGRQLIDRASCICMHVE